MDHEVVIATLERLIKPVYLVGGSVRDLLLKREITDFDFATPLLPDQIEQCIRESGRKPYLLGKRFGTVGVRIDGAIVEVTTFRSERYRPGSRKPNVSFVNDLTRDLGRRDFTMNAIALRKGKISDPFGGRQDLQERIIRSVGNPAERFNEDPLRMVRAARFAAQLEFTVENKTEQAMTRHSYKILQVSQERWVMELDKLLLAEKPSIGLEVLATTRLLHSILPEVAIQIGYDQNSPYHQFQLWEHTKRVVDGVPANLELRWAALFHDIGKPFTRTNKADRSNYVYHELVGRELVVKIGKYLNWSKERSTHVSRLVADHLKDDSPLREADNQAK